MMNFGYGTDDDYGGNFLDTELDMGIEAFSSRFESVDANEPVTDFDEKGGYMLEDIAKGYEIYTMS